MTQGNKMKSSRKMTRPRPPIEAVVAKGKPADSNYLRDHGRGAGPGIKYHPNRMAMQAAPDHGEHE
jgi:hypothetical protein